MKASNRSELTPPPFPPARIDVNVLRPKHRGRGPIEGADFQSADRLHLVPELPSKNEGQLRRVPSGVDKRRPAYREGDRPARAGRRALQPIFPRPDAQRRYDQREVVL